MSAVFGEALTLSQERGPDVVLVLFGDEFYARYETTDGYTAVYDFEAGLFCYAKLSNSGELISTGAPVTAPPPEGSERHLKESPEVRAARFEARFNKRGYGYVGAGKSITKTFGPNQGLLNGRTVNKGKVRGLVVLVDFKDVKSAVTADDVKALFNEPGYRGHGNACSVRDYFLAMSGGKLDFTCDVVGPVTLSKNRMFYAQNLLVEEALDAAVQMGVDLSRYDSKGEKVVDAVSFLYAGRSQELDWLWPHNHELELNYGKYRTQYYMLTGSGARPSELAIGTICHELGHMLCRWADTYDYGERDGDQEHSSGFGVYCLMGAGNQLNSERSPAPVCAYWRDLSGWCERVDLNKSGRFEARHGAYDKVLRWSTAKPNEYFIVENRSRVGHDAYLPSGGLAVYHCDILGSNEWARGAEKKHYQCALLQADGRFDLERNRNDGDEDDLFGATSGVALSDSTTPSSKCWDGKPSGFTLSDISAPGEVITFNVGEQARTALRGSPPRPSRSPTPSRPA
jgi:M6 family metalloprotease-like protein